MPLPDPLRVDAIIREVAATIILPYFRSLGDAGIRQKTGPLDLVTKADIEAEQSLTARLRDLVPGSVVLGEEAVAADPDRLRLVDGDAPLWIIDPVDGTLNFANGRPTFAVIVAFVHRGETLAGWIHDPCGGHSAMAEKGGGCWMAGARVRMPPPPVDVVGMAGILSTRFCSGTEAQRLRNLGPAVGAVPTLACAAHEYLRMLEGVNHYSLYHRLMPWDHAAGVLLLEEAGGRSALVDGAVPYGPRVLEGTLLNAADEPCWVALRDRLYG